MDIIRTIDSEDEINLQNESDSDADMKPRKNKKKDVNGVVNDSVFAEEFVFTEGLEDGPFQWGIDEAIKMAADKQNNVQSGVKCLDEKIAQAREARRKNKEKNELVDGREDKVIESGSSDESDDYNVENEAEKLFFSQSPSLPSDISFSDMNLSRPLLRAITSVGFASPTPIQAKTIPLALMGRDICACAATGTGKTGAFMLPILERLLYRPARIRISRVLVLVPTRELAIQVHSVGTALAQNTNIELCLATGGLDSKGQEASLRKNPDIIVATPGRLVDHLHNTPSFSLQALEILVLDEADRMLDEHFMDQMNEIVRLCPVNRQSLLFSATMTDEIEELARLSLKDPIRVFVDSNIDTADNLYQEFVRIRPNRESDREAIITALCCRSFEDHCLLFLPTKRLAHRLRILFGLLGLKATEMHGSLNQLQRLESLKKFKDGEADFLLATDLAARGLDIEKVKTVLNFSIPPTTKQYIHRVGRTARAGRSGRSVTLVGEKGRKSLKEIVKQAKVPPKSRVISPIIIEKYKRKIESLETEIAVILKQEKEEKEMHVAEMEMNKAKNMIDHEKEIYSRPARIWFQQNDTDKRKRQKQREDQSADRKKRKVDETEDDKIARKGMQFAKRETKREHKVTRQNKSDTLVKKKKGSERHRSVIAPFDEKPLNKGREISKEKFKSVSKTKGSSFKSKKRYKRR